MTANLLTLARRFSQLDQLEESAQQYRQVLALDPENPQVHFELGVIVFRLGRHQAATRHLQAAIELDASQKTFHNGLGIVYSSTGNLAAGVACFKRALELDPGYATACNNLGNNFKAQGNPAEAADYYQQAVTAQPGYTDAAVSLGDVLRQQGKLAAAADAYRAASANAADDAGIRFKLALTLYRMMHYSEAVTMLKEIAASHPEYPGVHNHIGLNLIRLGKFEEGIASYKKAIELQPDSAAPHNNLGNARKEQNDLDDAIASYRKALAIKPDHARAHSNLLLTLNYLSGTTRLELYEAALQFDAQHAGDVPQNRSAFHHPGDTNRRLRIGYVSPDFRAHSVAHFIRKLIGEHDRNQVEVYCFANIMMEDHVTDQFKAQADHWISIIGMDDRQAADRIRAERIDILIDLAGHTADNRLLMFAHKPAPVQVTWLGYPNTTGLSCMDYRLTDAIADPPGDSDRWYTEKLIRLPHGFLCFQSDEVNPAVTGCPHLEQGHITYGSFNALPKITAEVVRVWSQILTMTPDARLVLKSTAFMHENTKERYIRAFGKQGIAAERLDLPGLVPGRDQHLAMYSRIDIGLDPFPYNGTTTTCEALWMGVPVVSLLGNRHSGRVGASILQHVGAPGWVAKTVDEYIELACSLAADRPQLVRARETLRPKMLGSGFMDTRRFARSLENAYREMWRTWCGNHHR